MLPLGADWAATAPPLPAGVHARLPGGPGGWVGRWGWPGRGGLGHLLTAACGCWPAGAAPARGTRSTNTARSGACDHTPGGESAARVRRPSNSRRRHPTWPAPDRVGGRLNSGNAASCLLQWTMALTKDPQATSTSVLVDIGVVVRAPHLGLPALPPAAGSPQQRRGAWWPGWAALSTGKAPPPCRHMCLFTHQHNPPADLEPVWERVQPCSSGR